MSKETAANVKKMFMAIGVKPTLRGFYYWPVAVSYAKQKGVLNYRMCADVYEHVASKFKITSSKVERSMRTITDSYQKRFIKYFNYQNNKITNKELLALIVDKLSEKGGDKDERKIIRTKKTD